MLLTLCSIAPDFRRKPEASKISVKALISLFQEAVRLDQPDTLGGSLESLESYYKMNRQFATMARKYRSLISSEFDSDAILILADYVLNLELEEFKKIANNLPFLLNGSVFQENTAPFTEADIDPLWEPVVAALSTALPEKIDLTDSGQDALIFTAAAELTNKFPNLSALHDLDRWLTSRPEKYKNSMLLVSKLAVSKMIMKQNTEPLHVSLVVAMYNEHNRIRPKSRDNPNGEDLIRRKMKQMAWLFDHSPVRFDMILVDDGCPNGSGAIAEKIVQAEGFANARVLFIDDGINSRSPVLNGLHSPDDSRKGGAIQYGMWRAVEDSPSRDHPHIVVYTDADMAAPVNQIGLLLKLQNDQTMVSLGSRYDTGSVCRGPWGKNGEVQGLTEFDRRMVGLRGVLFRKLFPQTGEITDTQCGLKAFNAEILRKILLKTEERTFAFDIELLVLAAAAGTRSPFAPIYWHDSCMESNFWKSGN